MRRQLPTARRSNTAFTLIELLVVVVILGILMAVAVPTFLRQQTKAQDSRTQQYLTTAFKAIRSGTVDTGDQYPSSTSMVSWIQQSEPELTAERGDCLSGVTAAPVDAVLVDPSSTATSLQLCARSQSGNVWKLTASATGVQQLLNGTLVPLTVSGNEITDATRAAGVQGDGLSNDSSTGISESTTNLVTRSFFDGTQRSGQAGWQVGADTTNGASSALTQKTDTRFPVDSGKVGEWSFNEPTGSGWATVGIGVGSAVGPFTAGQTYTLSFWAAYQSGTTPQLGVKISDMNSTNTVMPTVSLTPTLTPTRYTFTFTAAAVGDAPVVFLNPSAPGLGAGVLRITGVQVEQKPIATSYVETNGAPATRAGARVQLPSALLSTTQMWLAFYAEPGWASSAPPGGGTGFPRLFSWWNNISNRLDVYFNESSKKWVAASEVGGSTDGAGSAVQSFGAWAGGQLVIAQWTASTVQISVGGGAFTSVARMHGIPSGLPALADIGTALGTSSWFDGNFLWAASGTGTLSDTDAAMINSWGNNDPRVASFPAAAQADFVWNGVGATGSLK